eukprot:2089080-Rhodomonas_salina.1
MRMDPVGRELAVATQRSLYIVHLRGRFWRNGRRTTSVPRCSECSLSWCAPKSNAGKHVNPKSKGAHAKRKHESKRNEIKCRGTHA